MELVLALAAVAALGLWLGLGRLLRRRSSRLDAAGGFLAGGAPVGLSIEDRQAELEEGALDPGELDDEPLAWDEGADDEV